MTSNMHVWENEEDEIPINVDAEIFSKLNFLEHDPLAGDHDDLEDPLEENRPNGTVEIGFGGRTRSGSRVKVTATTPANPPATSTNRIPSYTSKDDFTAEMDKNIAYIIDESIGLFGLDPREYHPFYLRIYKYIDTGIKNKHIKSFKDIKSYWEKYDRICAEILKEPKANTAFTGIESPYATYIKTGKVVVNGHLVNSKRNEAEINKQFMELEKSAKDIVKNWKEGQSKSILDDLNTRLEFFNHCKSMTFPADCVKMNKLWHKFLYEFSQPTNTQHVEVKRTDEANDLQLPNATPVLSHPLPATSASLTNRIPSYINKKAFTAEMDRDIECIIDESIGLFGLDPRGYHPFYLRIYKYIDIGMQNKHIKSFKDIKSHWEKYDRICTARLEKPNTTTFTGIESPYATYIKMGKVVVNGKEVNLKRNEDEIKKQFMELEKSAKDIVNQWKNKGQSKNILDDLNTRLQFFNRCKSMTFPADCVKMNKLWRRFLYEFSQPIKQQHVEVQRNGKANELKLPIVLVQKLSLQTIAKYQKSPADDVEIIELDDEDDFQSQIELDLPAMEDAPFDVDDKLMPTSETNPSESEKQGSKHKTENEMTESNLPVLVKIQIKNTVTCGQNHLPPSLQNEKSLIKTKFKSKIVPGRLGPKQEQKKRFKLSQLKVTHALKKLKHKRKRSTLVKKQAKLETLICSGAFSKVKSSFRKKLGLKKESSPSPSSPVPANIEGAETSPPLPTVVPVDPVDHLDTVTDSSIDKPVMENSVSFDKAASPAPLANQKLETGRFICNICGKVLIKRSSVKRHKLEVHNIDSNKRKKKQCPICLEKFLMLWPHFQQVHIQGVEGVEKGTKDTDNDDHIVEPPPKNSNNLPETYRPTVCEICGKNFPNKHSCVRHMEQIHETKGKQFLCQECPKQFKMKDTLDAHIREVHLGKNYRCDICSRVMQSGGKLWKHKVDVHGMSELEPPPGVTLMQCEYCGEKLLRGMLQHILKNHPEQEVAEKEQKERTKAMKREFSEEFRKRRCEWRRAQWKEWRATGKGPVWLQKQAGRKTSLKSKKIEVESLTCPTSNCGKVLKGNKSFELHQRRGHGSDDKFIPVLEKIQFLKRTPNETWQCVVCEENLDYVDEVKVHFALQHQQTVKKIQDISGTATTSEVLYCPHCGKKQDGDQALRDHTENSHPEMCCKCPECEWLVISPAELQEHFMLEHTDPDPVLEWRKHKDNPNASQDSKMKEDKSKVKSKKPETNANLKRKRPQPTRPSSRGRKRRNGSQKFAKCDDLNIESSSESSADSDDDFTRTEQLEPKGALSVPVRRSCRNAKSRFKKATDTTTTLANFTDSKLYQCQVYVKRLSKAEISFYCKSPL